MASTRSFSPAPPAVADIHPGDTVRTGPNATPVFRVVAINGDRAWVREDQSDTDHVVTLSRCRLLTRQ